jgi:hypothetical protein
MLDGQIVMSIGNFHVLDLAFQIIYLLQTFCSMSYATTFSAMAN